MNKSFVISKEAVMREVANVTSYTGAKLTGEDAEKAEALDRISTVDEDNEQLELFWNECRADLCKELINLVASETMQNDENYVLELEVSNRFDESQCPSMVMSLYSYFVHGIAARWYIYTNKQEASDYAARASACLDDIRRKALHKMRPQRPTYSD